MELSENGRFTGGCGALRPEAPADLITFAWRPGDTTPDVRTVVVAGVPMVTG